VTHSDASESVYTPSKRRFVLRTIKDGRVRIFGKTYAPVERTVPYDGRLDGQRWAFGLYPEYVGSVYLWGSERAYREGPEVDWETRPDVVNGVFVWAWWRERVAS
jgi:hypothetical protein